MDTRPIPCFDGWSATPDGEIVSTRGGCVRVLRAAPDAKGYLHLSYQRGRNEPQRGCLVHRLVLLAFVGPPPAGAHGSHVDGDPSNNRVENLRWESPSENERRKRAHGRAPVGEANGSARLTASVVRAIRRKVPAIGQKRAAALFGVSQGHVSMIVNRKAWAHII